MRSVCEWDWSAIAAWVQAIFSVVAIWAAFTLSKDERGHQRTHEFETQKAALIAIAKRGQATIDRVYGRIQAGNIPKAEVGWLRDEAEAISAIADDVDLTSLVESSLITAFVEVQEACRTTARRLKQNIQRVRGPAGTPETGVPMSPDKLDTPREMIAKAIVRLDAASQSKA